MYKMVFSAVYRGVPYERPVYEGIIADDGSIDWTERFSSYGGSGLTVPLRVVNHGGSTAILQYDTDADYYPHMYGLDVSTFDQVMVPNYDYMDEPWKQEFDLHSSGLSIVSWGDDTVGQMIRVSTDFGRTWGDAKVIDGLFDRIPFPDIDYAWYGAFSQQFSVALDKSTGTFYILISYQLDDETWENVWGIWKSTTGSDWMLVKEFGYYTYPFLGWMCSLTASDGCIYAGFFDDEDYSSAIMSSTDGGASWSRSDISTADIDYLGAVSLAAHGQTAIIAVSSSFESPVHVYRTTNGGASWSESLRVEFGRTESLYPYYLVTRAVDDLFLFTFCGICYPVPIHGSEVYKWIAGGIEHNMVGEDEPYLCFWMSLDGAATWDLKISPFNKYDELGANIYWQQTLDAILVLIGRGCFWPILLLLADDLPPCAPEKRPSTKCVTPGL
jgi:hypothetical protein